MAWSEIKKAINSNLSVPLNTFIQSLHDSWATQRARLDATISSRASQTDITAVKAKTDLVKPAIGTLITATMNLTGFSSAYKSTTVVTLTSVQRRELVGITLDNGTTNAAEVVCEIVEGGKTIFSISKDTSSLSGFSLGCGDIKMGANASVVIKIKTTGWSGGGTTATVIMRDYS